MTASQRLLEEEVLTSIRRIVRATHLYSSQLVSEIGLTAPQLSVLNTVASLDQATPTTIARRLRLSQPTVSGILERLQSKELVERLSAIPGDKRKHGYVLTDLARKLLIGSPPLLQESFRRKLGKLENWEQSMLLACMQQVADLIDSGNATV